MFLPVLRTVAQLIFDLLLRPMVVEHPVDEAGTGRIRLAAKHALVRGSHDRLRLVARHRPVRGSVAALTFPVVGAAPAARTPLLVTPALITLPVLVPAMVVMNIAPLAFPMTRVVLAALVVGRHPIRLRIGRVRPVAVVPTIPTVFRVPVAIDPDIVGTGLWWHAVRARRRRRGPDVNVE